MINLLRYQEKEKAKEMRRKEQDDLIRDIRKRQSDWKYSEGLEATVPGLEKPDMKWLKDNCQYPYGFCHYSDKEAACSEAEGGFPFQTEYATT